MSTKLHDITQSMQLTTRKGVGSIRWQRPLYVDFLPPCNHACPAGENIQSWLSLTQAGQYEKAWQMLIDDNPLPATHGRACYHPCEDMCNRGSLDTTIAIHAVERFLGDLAVSSGWRIPQKTATGKRVLIVGAGPAGLTCAYHLARMGHQVEIRDRNAEPGGMLMYGIPSYRLPREPLRQEIDRITSMQGITLVCNENVDDVISARAAGHFDAVFMSVGAQVANHIDIPAMDGKKLIDALSLLEHAKQGQKPTLGRAVAIIGGGNVAIDAARTAHRLGSQDALLIYHRDPAHLPALQQETKEAFAEGIKIKWLSTVRQFGADGILIEKMAMNPDGSIRPTGKTEPLAADSVILAVGEHSDLGLLRNAVSVETTSHGEVRVNSSLMTGEAGLFAGGDCIGGARTMTHAVGHGKRAAHQIDAWLRGESYSHPPSNAIVTFDMLHLLDYLEAPRSEQQEAPVAERIGFNEILSGLNESQARYEAQRCLSCGNCFECDNCYASCPEQAIIRRGPGLGYEVDMDLCSGCAVCFEQCPCHAIEMQAEPTDGPLVQGSLGEPIAPSQFKVRP